jgi:hypothetical protein
VGSLSKSFKKFSRRPLKKNKNRAEETEEKNRAPEKFEKKNSCRDFSIGKIIS